MKDLKKLVALTVLGSLVVLLGGYFLLVGPKRSQAAELRGAAALQVSANSALELQLAQLKAQARNLPKEQARLAAVAARIPTNRALPALIRALNDAAKGAGVELLSVSPGASALVTPTVVAAPVVSPSAATTATGNPAAPPALGAAPGSATPGTTLGAAPTGAEAGQLAQLPVTLSLAGGYFQMEQFVSALEDLPRSLRLTGVARAPGSNPMVPAPVGSAAPVGPGATLTSTVNAVVFQAVNRPAATPVTVPSTTTAPAK